MSKRSRWPMWVLAAKDVNPRITALAQQIKAAQTPQITTMRTLLGAL